MKPCGHQEGPLQRKEVIGSVQLFQLEFLDSEVFNSAIFSMNMQLWNEAMADTYRDSRSSLLLYKKDYKAKVDFSSCITAEPFIQAQPRWVLFRIIC